MKPKIPSNRFFPPLYLFIIPLFSFSESRIKNSQLTFINHLFSLFSLLIMY